MPECTFCEAPAYVILQLGETGYRWPCCFDCARDVITRAEVKVRRMAESRIADAVV